MEDIHFESESFDAVTLWNVFEHLYNPNGTLQEIHRLLKKDGILVMIFPNWDSLDHRLFGKGWIGYDAPRHLFAYPAKVYSNMIEHAGFNIIGIQAAPNNYFAFVASLENWFKLKFGITFLTNGIIRLAKIPGIRFFLSPWTYLFDKLGLGSTIQVVARKQYQV